VSLDGLDHRPVVVLVGPMGAGKTTVGRLLARRWGVTIRDTDHDVEATAGRSISDLFVESGEAAFRAMGCPRRGPEGRNWCALDS
jgi:shikimate kinase